MAGAAGEIISTGRDVNRFHRRHGTAQKLAGHLTAVATVGRARRWLPARRSLTDPTEIT
jgi:hypothetical protein